MALIDIRNYSDYRAFLRDFVAAKHEKQPSWSYASWSRQLGLSSPSAIAMIVNGQRHPGTDLIRRLSQYFKFSKEEARFFHDLVNLQKKLNDPRLLVILAKELRPLPQTPAAKLSDDFYFRRDSYLLREMTGLLDFQEDHSWIHQILGERLHLDEIKDLLEGLLREGLLERDPNGKLIPRAATRTQPPEAEKVQKLHTELVEATRSAVFLPEELRAFRTSFLNIRLERLPEAKKLIDEFQDRFSALIEQKPGEAVFQLNIHFFPAHLPTGQPAASHLSGRRTSKAKRKR